MQLFRTIAVVVFIGLTGSFSVKAQNRQDVLDSLLLELKNLKQDTNGVNLLCNLAFAYCDADPDMGIPYALQALEISKKLDWTIGEAKAELNLGNCYKSKGDFTESLPRYTRSLELYQSAQNNHGLANALNGLGIVFYFMSNFPNALDYYFRALEIYEGMGDSLGIARMSTNIGIVYQDLGDYPKAIENYEKSLKLCKKYNFTHLIDNNENGLGVVFQLQGEHEKALQYFGRALAYGEKVDDPNAVANAVHNMANSYQSLRDFDKAIEYNLMAVQLSTKMNDIHGVALGYYNAGSTYHDLVVDTNEVNDAALSKFFGGDRTKALQQIVEYMDTSIELQKQTGHLNNLIDCYEVLSDAQRMLGNYSAALETYKLHAAMKDSVFNMEKEDKITQISMQYEFEKREASAKAEQDKKDINQRTIRNSIAATLGGALIFLVVVYRQRNRISKARKRSDELLVNILPEQVAEELKINGTAEAKQFDSVTVMFADIKGFTMISENLSPKELVSEIHQCFKEFDRIIDKYNIEKIKTMGDSYICAGGIPVENENHAENVVDAALEIQQFLQQKLSGSPLSRFGGARIGIHTGPVVAGIVGVKKFSYDIWGDTVNVASRMESSGEAGKVNISGDTYALIRDKFECTYRGKVQAKNKGEVDMYFVNGRIDRPKNQTG